MYYPTLLLTAVLAVSPASAAVVDGDAASDLFKQEEMHAMDQVFTQLHSGGPDAFDFIDLDRDGEISREEFEEAEKNGLEVIPGVWKTDQSTGMVRPVKEPVAAVATKSMQTGAACDKAAQFNASMAAAKAATEEVYKKLVRSSMQIMSEQKVEGAALQALLQLQKQAVEGLHNCDKVKEKAKEDAQAYKKELQELLSVLNSTRLQEGEPVRSLLARKAIVVQTVAGVDEAETLFAEFRATLHHRVDKAADRLKACRQRVSGLTDSTAQASACEETEKFMNATYEHVKGEIEEMIKAAEKRGSDDSCATAVLAEFETGRARLESEIQAAQRLICNGISLGEEASSDLVGLGAKFNETNALITGPCKAENKEGFEAIMTELKELADDRPQPKGADKYCAKLLANA
eukprot:CAMPEP_0178415260 /NCGR_PEP_ID=MMETSP0689_2-20121128/23461_1 /TAXON_ID=160604 /ORGANISM="Amphidinium massartii, Strain CS-259" /LENGTH=403 /DNA_ID=CAMNT_0020036577 /DNA_START=131 /DNA_END=1338 /DNA_ORIENTATION=+